MPPLSVVLSVDMVNVILIAFIREVTGFPADAVLVETRTGPRPIDLRPYATILWQGQEALPQFDAPFYAPGDDEAGTEELKNESHCTVRLTIRGDNAYNIASELRYELDRGQRAFDLWNILGFAGVSNVVDLSAVYGGKVQQRTFIDLSFYAAFGRTYSLDWFRSVPWIINGASHFFPSKE